ncbi:MAG: GDSL-type esterase/lipase family protein [Desulfomonile sp.]|nr:GDSL-type esterase/lipase family protein [Desulfomonile sp.]
MLLSHRVKQGVINAALVVGSTVLALIFAALVMEVVLRIVSPSSVLSRRVPLRPHFKKELKVNIPGISPTGMHSTNKWGLRGDEPPDEWTRFYTIVTIGGSTTQDFHIDDRKTWSYRLQEYLRETCPKSFLDKCPRVWVGNGGTCGQSTRAHIMFMEDVISKIRPDAVILLVGINDLGFSISREARERGNHWDELHWKMKLCLNSWLIQVLYIWKKILLDKVHVVEFSVARRTFEPRPLAGKPMPVPEDPRELLVGLDEYRANLRKIITIGKALNVRMLFLTQPTLTEDNDYWRSMDGGFFWIEHPDRTLSAAGAYRLLNEYNKTLMEVCAEQRVECFDLASAVPHEDQYFTDTVHFSERGADLVAQKVAEYLSASPGSPQ